MRDELGADAADELPVVVSGQTLTDLGLSLQHLMIDIKAWAEVHMDVVLVNRAEYDTEHD